MDHALAVAYRHVQVHTQLGQVAKSRHKNYIVKFVKLIDHIYAYCSLTNFEYEVNETTGYRNYMSLSKTYVPYTRHYNPLLIRNRSLIQTIHESRILRKKPLEKMFFYFKKWVKSNVKSIQTAGYIGARTVIWLPNPTQ